MKAIPYVLHAVWALYWFVVAIVAVISNRLLAWIPALLVGGAWVFATLFLWRHRKWAWWICFSALIILSGVGICLFGSLLHMTLYPDAWAGSSQPGTLAIGGGIFYFVPSALLVAHLLVSRRDFTGVSPQKAEPKLSPLPASDKSSP